MVAMVAVEETTRSLCASASAKSRLNARRRNSKCPTRVAGGDFCHVPAVVAEGCGVQPPSVCAASMNGAVVATTVPISVSRTPLETEEHSQPEVAVVVAADSSLDRSRLADKGAAEAAPAGDETREHEVDEEAPASDIPDGGFCDERVVRGLAAALEHMAAMAKETQIRTNFHSVRPPPVTITAYTQRLAKFFNCSAECFVLALVYIDRVIQRHPHIVVSSLTCHRLLATSLTLAAKFQDDVFYSNAYYAKVCGLATKELCGLEEKLLVVLNYRLLVQREEFDMYRTMLHKAAGARDAAEQ